MWGMGTTLRVWLGLAVLGSTAPRVRADADVDVEWSAPAECPSAKKARAQIARLLGTDGRVTTGQARVEIARTSLEELRARVVLRSEGGAREQVLTDADCSALTRAAALVVAMALEPQAPSVPQPSAAQRPPATTRPATTDALGTPTPPPRAADDITAPGRIGSGWARAPQAAPRPPATTRPDTPTPPPGAAGGIHGASRNDFESARTLQADARDGRGERSSCAARADGSGLGRDLPGDAGGSQAAVQVGELADADAVAQSGERAVPGGQSTEHATADQKTATPPTAAHSPGAGVLTRAVLATAAGSDRGGAERIRLPMPRPDRERSVTDSPLRRRQLQRAPTDAPEPPQAGASSSRRHPHGFVGLAGGVASGIVPNLAPTGVVSAGIASHALRAALRFAYLPGQRTWLDETQGVGGHVSLASVAAELGVRLHLSPFEVPLLAGLEGGWFRADALGVQEHEARSSGWLASFVGTGLAYSWGGLWTLGLRAEASLALRRPSFALARDGSTEPRVFHRPQPLGARVFIGLEMQLP